jgi:uncharacterized protein YjaG (DUF416 family)
MIIMGNCNKCGSDSCNCGPSCGCKPGSCVPKKDWMVKTGDVMADDMARIADKAWEHLLVDKMKVLWQNQMGEKIDKIAEAAVGVSMSFHMNSMKGKMEMGEAVGKLKESFA